MIGSTRGGDGWLWCPVLAAVLLFGGRRRLVATVMPALAALAGIAVFWVLKRVAGRKRPVDIAPHCWAELLPPDRFSFPSGHTITSFAVATSLSLYYPSLGVPFLLLAASVGASRVVLGMHFLSDVVAGAGLGAALGYGGYRLWP